MSLTPFRTPLWSQESAYSAREDRGLIAATFTGNPTGGSPSGVNPTSAGGVVGVWDLRVIPRGSGLDPVANPNPGRAITVLPGKAAIAGTNQADQGTYLVELAQPVTLDIPSSMLPPAGRRRRIYVFAQVDEGDGTNPATWDIILVPCPDASTQIPVPLLPQNQWPRSALLLATMGDVYSTTQRFISNAPQNSTTDADILDIRQFSRPAAMGSSQFYLRHMNNLAPTPQGTGWNGWDRFDLFLPPTFQPFDMTTTVEFQCHHGRPNAGEWAGLDISAFCWFRSADQGWRLGWWDVRIPRITSIHPNDHRMFSYTWEAMGVTLAYPASIWIEIFYRRPPLVGIREAMNVWNAQMQVRLTPAGGTLGVYTQ